MTAALRIGTRGSPLALAQAYEVKALWERSQGSDSGAEIVEIKTTGDQVLDRPLAEIGGKGLFTRELDTALIDGRIDIAVHSMKDVPTFLPAEIALTAMLPREDVRDCWLSAGGVDFTALPAGAKVGTCSLRRKAQILHRRPDLDVVDLRGNIQTRMKKLDSGEFAATMLAMAGLNRMGIAYPGMAPMDPSWMVPAAGQAAIGITARTTDGPIIEALSALDDAKTSICVHCERALLAALDGSCRTPIGAHATLDAHNYVQLTAVLASPDGKIVHRQEDKANSGDHKAMGQALGYALKRVAGPNFLAHW